MFGPVSVQDKSTCFYAVWLLPYPFEFVGPAKIAWSALEKTDN